MTEYILFVIQCANFAARSILIPYEEFVKVRKEEYEMLLRNSVKNIDFGDVVIKNLLIENIIRVKNFGTCEKTEWVDFIGHIEFCAEEWGSAYPEIKDREWAENSIFDLPNGFDNVRTYKEILATNYNIVDSFLILEAENGKLRERPNVHTNTEMLRKYCGIEDL